MPYFHCVSVTSIYSLYHCCLFMLPNEVATVSNNLGEPGAQYHSAPRNKTEHHGTEATTEGRTEGRTERNRTEQNTITRIEHIDTRSFTHSHRQNRTQSRKKHETLEHRSLDSNNTINETRTADSVQRHRTNYRHYTTTGREQNKTKYESHDSKKQ